MTGHDSVTDAFNRMELDEKYRDSCYGEVQNGKILLLVNKDYDSEFELIEDGTLIPKEELLTDNDLDDEVFSHKQQSDNLEENIGFDSRKEKNVVGDFIVTDVENEEFRDR